jgi:hypothetical protein
VDSNFILTFVVSVLFLNNSGVGIQTEIKFLFLVDSNNPYLSKSSPPTCARTLFQNNIKGLPILLVSTLFHDFFLLPQNKK